MDFRTLILLGNCAGAVALFLLFGYPNLTTWKAERQRHGQLLETRAREQKNTENFEKLKTELGAHGNDIARLQEIAPLYQDPKTDTPELLEVFGGIAKESGVVLKAVSADAVQSAAGVTSEGATADQGELLVPRKITISIFATPRGLRFFLQNIAKSLRLFELQAVSFKVDPTQEAQAVSITLMGFVLHP